MMALDRFGAITSHNYMTKSSGGHYRVRIWIVTLLIWLCAYFLTRQMWVNTEYMDEGDIATCKMNWGLPVDEDIGDFVRNENGCHNCPVDGDVLEQCVELHANYDQSPVKMAALTKLGWNEESCLLAYHGNSTGADYESDYPQESSGPETSTDSTSSLYEGGSMSSAESSDYTEAQNYLCGCPGSHKERVFHILLFIVSLIIPLTILIICYSSVYCLIRSIQNDVNGVGERNSGNRHVARNTLNNIAILVLCYVVCWMPFHIYMLMNSFGFDVNNDTCSKIEDVTRTLAWSHACLNPILYGIKGSYFRKRARRAFQNFAKTHSISRSNTDTMTNSRKWSKWRKTTTSLSTQLSTYASHRSLKSEPTAETLVPTAPQEDSVQDNRDGKLLLTSNGF